jgi:hypothetical protein
MSGWNGMRMLRAAQEKARVHDETEASDEENYDDCTNDTCLNKYNVAHMSCLNKYIGTILRKIIFWLFIRVKFKLRHNKVGPPKSGNPGYLKLRHNKVGLPKSGTGSKTAILCLFIIFFTVGCAI